MQCNKSENTNLLEVTLLPSAYDIGGRGPPNKNLTYIDRLDLIIYTLLTAVLIVTIKEYVKL